MILTFPRALIGPTATVAGQSAPHIIRSGKRMGAGQAGIARRGGAMETTARSEKIKTLSERAVVLASRYPVSQLGSALTSRGFRAASPVLPSGPGGAHALT